MQAALLQFAPSFPLPVNSMSDRDADRPNQCPACGEHDCITHVRVPHRLHLCLTVLTLGLWGVSYLADVISAQVYPWTCKNCGRRTSRTFDATEDVPDPVESNPGFR
jgi:hypothetical protein